MNSQHEAKVLLLLLGVAADIQVERAQDGLGKATCQTMNELPGAVAHSVRHLSAEEFLAGEGSLLLLCGGRSSVEDQLKVNNAVWGDLLHGEFHVVSVRVLVQDVIEIR